MKRTRNYKLGARTSFLAVSGLVPLIIAAYQCLKFLSSVTVITDLINPWVAIIITPLVVGIVLLVLAIQNHYQKRRVRQFIDCLSKNRKLITNLLLSGLIAFVFIVSRTANMDNQLINLAMGGLGLLFYSLMLIGLIFTIRKHGKINQNEKDHFLNITILLISMAWFFMIFTRIGFQPDQAFWNVAGVPMMWVSLAGIILMILFLDQLGSLIQKKLPQKLDTKIQVLLEVFLVLAIWLCAALIWIKTPYSNSHFLLGPIPPTGHYWPSSDARLMDLGGQYLIIGGKLETPYFTEKPFYALFLGLLHYLFGQSYQTVTNIQIMFLALIPVLLYYLGKQLSGKLFGIALASFAIIKEATAILFTYKISVSNSRLMMTEVPSALLLIFVTVLVFNWLRKEEPLHALPLLAGTTIGIASYIRSNNLFVLFVLLVYIVFTGVKNKRIRWLQIGFFLLGVTITILPWMVYNQVMYGKDPLTWKINAALSTRFDVLNPEDRDETPLVPINSLPDPTLSPTESESLLMPDEPPVGSTKIFALTDQAVAQRLATQLYPINEIFSNFDPQQNSLLAKSNNLMLAASFLVRTSDGITPVNESEITQEEIQIDDIYDSKVAKIIGHFLNNQVKALFVLPFQLYPARPTAILEQAYWNEPVDWSGEMPAEHIIAFFCNLLLISLGISYAWKNFQFAGLVPLVIEMAYYLSNALVRTSGSRYLAAVDWVVYLYFLLGLWVILRTFRLLPAMVSIPEKPFYASFKGTWISLALCLLIGMSLPVINLIFPALYDNDGKAEVLSLLPLKRIETEVGITPDDMQNFYDNPNTVFLHGREIYPAYLAMDHIPGGKALNFTLLTPDLYDVVIPYGIEQTEELPAGEDMLVLGCKNPDTNQILAYMGYFVQSDKLIWSTSTTFNSICPKGN